MINSFNKIYKILQDDEKRSLVYISILLLIGMFLEIFGIGIVFPFILSILSPEKLIEIDLVNKVFLFFEIIEKINITQILLSFLVFIYLTKTIFMIYLAYKQNEFISKITANLSNRLYKTYLTQPLEFHVKNNSSALIKNIQIEVTYFKSFCMSFITIAIELSLAVAIFLTLIFVESLGAFFVGIYFIFLSIIYYQTVKPVLNRWGKTRETIVKKISNLKINTDDYVNIIGKTIKSNFCVNLNLFSLQIQRKIMINGKGFSLEGDLIENTIRIFEKNKKKIKKFKVDTEYTYKAQHKSLLSNVCENSCTYRQGVQLMLIINKIKNLNK